MQIEKYISELLFEHDCVIVPGLGGFVCNYSSANIHPGKRLFYPPFKKISFNRNLKNNDGLLANQIAQAGHVSYSEANRFLSEYVEQLNKDLSANKRVRLNNIGAFYPGEESTLLFEQDETINYLSDSFGFSAFHSPPIQREPIGRKIENTLKDKVIIPSKEKRDASAEFITTKEGLSVTSAKRRTMRYLAASAAVLLIAFILWVPFQTGLLKNIDYSSMNPFAAKEKPLYKFIEREIEEIKDASSNAEAIKKLLSNDTASYVQISIDKNIPTITVRLKDEVVVEHQPSIIDHQPLNRFHIIGGAFAVPQNAERFYKKLVRQGYHASIINKEGKKFRFVSYDGFATREQALQAMDKIRMVQGDAWLMRM